MFMPELIAAIALQTKAQVCRERRYRDAIAKLPQDQQDRIHAERRHRETIDALDRLAQTVERKRCSVF
jgi:hypothetical protein